MRSALSLTIAALLGLFAAGCIIVKETVREPEEDPTHRSMKERVSRIEARLDAHATPSSPAQKIAEGALGEVTDVSASGGQLMLRLRPGNNAVVGTRLAVVGTAGFKGLVEVAEIYEETKVSAKSVEGAPMSAAVGDQVLATAGAH
jgi:hypothetical protein